MSRIPHGLTSIIESFHARPGNLTRRVEDLNDRSTSFITDLARRHSVRRELIAIIYRHPVPEEKRHSYPKAMVLEFEGDNFSIHMLVDEKRQRWWSKIHWESDNTPFLPLDLFVEA